MANIVTKQTLNDGPRNAVIHAYLESDNSSGDEAGTVLVDVSSLSGSPSSVKVKSVHASLTGFSAKLLWDATTNVEFLQLTEGETDYDWTSVGGLQNNAGAGVTGDILISTTDFAQSGDQGSITIHVQKKP